MSRYVVTVGSDALCAFIEATHSALLAVQAITPPADDEVQTEAVINARCAVLAALRCVKGLQMGPVRVEA